MAKILITGGAGYVGAVLVPKLLKDGHEVTVLDLMIYGDGVFGSSVVESQNFRLVKGDIRSREVILNALDGIDTVIHLACISNDPSFDLDPELGKSINLDSFRPLVELSIKSGVKRFINASSSSVYGVKSEPDVSELLDHEPLTDYSKYKSECESILLEYASDDFTVVSVRPATVCGVSPRQRLDVIVNILVNHAHNRGEVLVFGGEQLRPNIHIEDMTDFYRFLIDADRDLIHAESFNIGADNHSVRELASIVSRQFDGEIGVRVEPTDDIRSYHISSSKAESTLGFKVKRTISDAVSDLKVAFEKGHYPDSLTDEKYFNVKKMQNSKLS